MPIEEYLCGPPVDGQPEDAALCNPCSTNCDCGTLATLFFAVISIVGFAVVLGTKSSDNIFDVYGVENTAELQEAFLADIPYLQWLREASNNRTEVIINDLYRFNHTTTSTTTTTTPTTPTTTTPTTTTTTTTTTTPTTTTPTTPAPTPPPPPPPTTSTTTTPTATTIYNYTAPSTTTTTTTTTPTTTTTTTTPTTTTTTTTPTTTTTTTPTTTTTTTTPTTNATTTIDFWKPNASTYPLDPTWLQPCLTSKSLTGTWGKVCMEQALNSANIYFQLSRWTVFRDTLYFIAALGSVGTLILVYVVHRIKNPSGGQCCGPAPIPPQGIEPPPIVFTNTPLYHVVRAVWFCVGLVVVLWTVTVLYEYMGVMAQYKKFSEGDLHSFFGKYDAKFVPSVIIVTIFLAWPLANMLLEVAFFIVLLIPYYFYRNMSKQGIEFIRYPIETPLDAIPGWVRLDAFFTEFRQAKRLGFSLPMWFHITGTYDEFLDCNPMGPGGYPPGYPGYPGYPPPPGSAGQVPGAPPSLGSHFPPNAAVDVSQPTIVHDDLESPSRRSKKSKKRADDSGSQSMERRSKSKEKKEKRRHSVARDESATEFNESNASGAFSSTNALEGFDNTTRKEKKKKDKTDKKDKSDKLDKSDRVDKEKKPKKEKSKDKSKSKKHDLDDQDEE